MTFLDFASTWTGKYEYLAIRQERRKKMKKERVASSSEVNTVGRIFAHKDFREKRSARFQRAKQDATNEGFQEWNWHLEKYGRKKVSKTKNKVRSMGRDEYKFQRVWLSLLLSTQTGDRPRRRIRSAFENSAWLCFPRCHEQKYNLF